MIEVPSHSGVEKNQGFDGPHLLESSVTECPYDAKKSGLFTGRVRTRGSGRVGSDPMREILKTSWPARVDPTRADP